METSRSLQELSTRLSDNISRVICGKEEVIQKVVVCLFCAGHILLEDIPGTGKTTLTKALAKSIDGRLYSGAVYARFAPIRFNRRYHL